MRKLLLGTTALAAAATLSANAALADVSISGMLEWSYDSRSSNVAANDGTSFGQDSDMQITFTEKTDSGLTLTYANDIDTDAGTLGLDELSLTERDVFQEILHYQGKDTEISLGKILNRSPHPRATFFRSLKKLRSNNFIEVTKCSKDSRKSFVTVLSKYR